MNELPPAATPAAVAPDIGDVAPPAEGQGRLIIDVVDGSTPVQRVRMASTQTADASGQTSYQFYESYEQLCPSTPCVADLAVGNVLLGFPVLGDPGTVEVELVHVGAEPSVYRRQLTLHEGHSGAGLVLGILGVFFGGSSMITGAVLLPVGLANDTSGMVIAGGITLGVGAVLTALGIWGITSDVATYREGASTHFALSEAQ